MAFHTMSWLNYYLTSRKTAMHGVFKKFIKTHQQLLLLLCVFLLKDCILGNMLICFFACYRCMKYEGSLV